MSNLIHIHRFEFYEADFKTSLLKACTNYLLEDTLLERNGLSSTTYTTKSKIYDSTSLEGKRILGPTAFPVKYMDREDVDYEDLSFDGDDVYLWYDFIFTKHSVTFSAFTDADTDYICVDYLASAIAAIIEEDDQQKAQTYMTALQTQMALYLDASLEKESYKTNHPITRGILGHTL